MGMFIFCNGFWYGQQQNGSCHGKLWNGCKGQKSAYKLVQVQKGVCQRYVLPLLLLKLYSEQICHETLRNIDEDINKNGDMLYVDDTT